MDKILSIVIPTKNRYYYLDFIIKYFLSIESDSVELIIQDNSDPGLNEKLLADLKKYNDQRIKYYFLEGHISQTENCDLAISRASGKYITMIGDDDIFSKHIVSYCESWNKLGYEAILPNKASYIWPDVTPRIYQKKMSGTLRIQNYTGKVTALNPKELPLKISLLGGTDIMNLPRVYHGIVKKEILEKVYAKCGTYSPGPSPDIANAIALCGFLSSYVLIDLPLITSGQAKSSAGGKGAQGLHYGEIAKVEQLHKDTAKKWDKNIPFYWSGKTIYAESSLQAFRAMSMSLELKKFNYNYLYAACLVFDGRKDYIIRIWNAFKANIEANFFKILFIFFKIWLARINFHIQNNLKLIIFNTTSINKSVVPLSNTHDVTEIIDACIDSQEKA